VLLLLLIHGPNFVYERICLAKKSLRFLIGLRQFCFHAIEKIQHY